MGDKNPNKPKKKKSVKPASVQPTVIAEEIPAKKQKNKVKK